MPLNQTHILALYKHVAASVWDGKLNTFENTCLRPLNLCVCLKRFEHNERTLAPCPAFLYLPLPHCLNRYNLICRHKKTITDCPALCIHQGMLANR
jgi:hypothetical protein